MRANLKALPTFEKTEAASDLIKLLEGIKSLVFNFEATKSLPDALVCALRNFYRYQQPKSMSDEEFLRKYKSFYEVITQSGGKSRHASGDGCRATQNNGNFFPRRRIKFDATF